MANRQPLKTTFQPDQVIRPIYTGGSVALSNGAQILATTLEGDAILTDPSNGKHLAKIEGVCLPQTSLATTSLTSPCRMANPSRP